MLVLLLSPPLLLLVQWRVAPAIAWPSVEFVSALGLAAAVTAAQADLEHSADSLLSCGRYSEVALFEEAPEE